MHVGPIARVGPNDLVTSSLDLLCHMSAARSPYTRGGWYYGATRTRAGKDNVFSTLDEGFHDKRRRQLAAGVSSKSFFMRLPSHSRLVMSRRSLNSERVHPRL